VRRRRWWEESIFLVGTPQCLLAEGLADLGSSGLGKASEPTVAEHMRPLAIRYDTEVVAAVADAGEALGAVRTNAAFRLHEDGADPDTVIDEWPGGAHAAGPRRQGRGVPDHPTWRAYSPATSRFLCAGLHRRGPGAVRAAPVRAADPGDLVDQIDRDRAAGLVAD